MFLAGMTLQTYSKIPPPFSILIKAERCMVTFYEELTSRKPVMELCFKYQTHQQNLLSFHLFGKFVS